MKSSRTERDQILGMISRKRAEQFLLEVANTKPLELGSEKVGAVHVIENVPAARVMKYSDVFSPERGARRTQGNWSYFTSKAGIYIRRLWDAPDQRHRDWFFFKLRELWWNWYFDIPKGSLAELEKTFRTWNPPDPTSFEAILFHLQRIADRLRHCPNPDCPSPYFIATKKGQKYCSETCAVRAQREAKRRWWNSNRAKSIQ